MAFADRLCKHPCQLPGLIVAPSAKTRKSLPLVACILHSAPACAQAIISVRAQREERPTLGGWENPNDLATETRSRVCTLKMSFSWWEL